MRNSSDRARIVHVSSVHGAMDTRILYKECATLARAGYEVHLVTPETPGADTSRFGVTLHVIPRISERPQRMVLSSWNAMRLACSLRPDVMHLHDSELLPHVVWASTRCRHIVFDMHEDLPKALLDKPWIGPPLSLWLSKVARFAERLLLSRLPVVLAEDSYQVGRSWLRRFQIVRNMPVLSEFEGLRTEPALPLRLGYIGSITPTRGSLTLLDVVAMLRDRGVPVGVDFVGPMSREVAERASRKVKELELSDVQFHGAMPPENGYQIIRSCAIGVALLHPMPNYVESYPTKVFEYMALGLPVVASDFPLYRKLIVEAGAGIVVDPLNVGAIADAVESLLRDASARALMAECGRSAVVEHFSWEREGERLLEFYEKILECRGGNGLVINL